jgi:hypothetical protein
MKPTLQILWLWLLLFSLEMSSAIGATPIPAPALDLTHVNHHPDCSIEFQVDATEAIKVLIESSSDLKAWSPEGLWEPNTMVVFTNQIALSAHRFYRASSANDDFQDRFAIEGTNLLIQASTLGATAEPTHALTVFFDDYSQTYDKNLWWTWTAPSDGAVMIKRGETSARYGSGVVVYTGQSLQDLVRIWDTSNPDDAFFVKQGVQYQIGFGTVSPGFTSFTLEMVAPVPPGNVIAWVGDQLVFGSPITAVGEAIYLSVRADGTRPLSYQWRKDGLDIPGATNTVFFKQDIELTDAGLYSVRVSNEAGTTFSNNIAITVLQERPERTQFL